MNDKVEILNAQIEGAVLNQGSEGFDQARSIWNFGGATADVPANVTAFGDRSMPYMFSIDSVWSEADDDEKNITWTRNFWRQMQPWSDQGRMYLNFPGMGEEGDQLLKDTFGDNYTRLREIKQKYDPDNRFRFNQNITPA
jgi:FAD/FMN-containing dehydrogenase